ncbi:tRNA-binding protein [Phenylobacterium kunshanense]|uniref:tRNA-binding protein n=2 Tax=Phenylobacterium kunshanense TaxID=1445034 RepID=A0A328BIY4_9CAUL|nr:tRNA-binding protein [Phenylobacterium kunshanense]
MRVGTVLSADRNPIARKPAFVLKIDLGPSLGVRTSSAQLVARHDVADLVGRQVICVVNFPAKHVAGVRSEVLVLAATPSETEAVVIRPDQVVPNGVRIA